MRPKPTAYPFLPANECFARSLQMMADAIDVHSSKTADELIAEQTERALKECPELRKKLQGRG